MKYAVITFGCKVNQYESTAIDNAMRDAGFEYAGIEDSADIVIINSCSVTENGDKKAKHAVRAAKKLSKDTIVVLTGCFPQAFPDAAKQSGADIVCGTARRAEIPALVRSFIENRKINADMSLPDTFEEPDMSRTTAKTRAFIKIEDGCDRYCSYCVIPYARGKVRSRSLDSIAGEARICAEQGHRELVLVGINLSRYGSDIGCDLADAVNAASLPETVVRVRLSSLEPELMTDDLIAKLAGNSKLCPHFHLSLQSGCDATLKRMNRHYTSAEYLDLISRLRRFFPNCAITTDVMVGFAGETDEEFAQSLEFVRNAGFARVHVFTYSIRGGTAAEKRNDHIPESVKAARYAEMSAAADKIYRDFLAGNIGKTADVLIQKRTSPEFAAGLTPDYVPVRIYGSAAQKHDIVRVKITGAGDGYCTGKEMQT
ncbi:MAG: tRNA (N(6)-L-threonylcarbamoyladenosine(37)-C(2))-methylthiotransferase MtaB [Ruminiclostridium sp.]|nr:tRNA (N(6)-L-threonylcarbamoyladenosine(37)-C(2))-methylthiotransferase MtaB [Ruminiclostridium sp.]